MKEFDINTFNAEDAKNNAPLGKKSCKYLVDKFTELSLKKAFEASILGNSGITYHLGFNHKSTIKAIIKRLERRGFLVDHVRGTDEISIFWHVQLHHVTTRKFHYTLFYEVVTDALGIDRTKMEIPKYKIIKCFDSLPDDIKNDFLKWEMDDPNTREKAYNFLKQKWGKTK